MTVFFLTLLVMVLPLSLLAYFISRQITQRLAGLTGATAAMRTGDYSLRVTIEGEDEIAQLQRDFNEMAEALERIIRELQLERDMVASLQKAQRELLINISHDLRTPRLPRP